jgi:hypothetical protein
MKACFRSILLLRALFLLACGSCFQVAHGQNGPPAQPGTFQLLTTEPKAGEVFSTDILPFIEAHRDAHEPRLVSVGRYSWVLILSQDVIGQPGFQPLPEEIITVDESTLDHWLLQWQ